jgi:hypothetical protein
MLDFERAELPRLYRQTQAAAKLALFENCLHAIHDADERDQRDREGLRGLRDRVVLHGVIGCSS